MISLTQSSNTWLSRAGIHPHSPSGTLCGTLNEACLLYSVLQFSIEDNNPFSPQQRAVPKLINTERTLWQHGDSLTSPQPALGHISCEDFPPFALQQHDNAIIECLADLLRPTGLRRSQEGRARPMCKASMVLLYLDQS